MSGYTGRPKPCSPGAAMSRKLAVADSGARSSMSDKIAIIMDYIRQEAALHYEGDILKVPCPSSQEWSSLAAGRGAVLPNESQLTLYASVGMRELAATRGGLRRTYFAVAKHRIIQQNKSSS